MCSVMFGSTRECRSVVFVVLVSVRECSDRLDSVRSVRSAVGQCSVVFVSVRECSCRFGCVRSAVGQCSVVFISVRVGSVVRLGYFGQVRLLLQVELSQGHLTLSAHSHRELTMGAPIRQRWVWFLQVWGRSVR